MLNTMAMLALSAGGAVAASRLNADITVLYLGVPVNVVVAACAGALAGFAFAAPLETRKRIFQVAFACVVLGCTAASLLEAFIAYRFKAQIEPKVLASMALILSFWLRWIIPAVIERIGPWLDKIPFLAKKEK